ncbi:MAG: permease [Spirochaetales bacterium]|nr:permease [Spirochaetales bacterium]
MSITSIVINVFVLVCLLVSLLKNRSKTLKALKTGFMSLFKISPTILSIIILIGLFLTFIPKDLISKLIGQESGVPGLFTAALLGAILHIPAIVSFPLSASLIKGGASITAVAAFITTLTMIGMVTLPLEIKELGRKFALLRNGISFVIALIIAILIGVFV